MNRVVNQRYTLLRSLGRGGMGEVFLAADRERPETLVALKYLAGRGSGPDADRLREEFLRTSRLKHPHLVQVFDLEIDRERGESFISMEYVEGVDFQSACRGESLSRLVELTLQACQALDYLHSQGVVHRDLKPENLLVSPPAEPHPSPRLRLLDFGLSGNAGAGSAPAGGNSLAGTPAYMAPESFRGEWVDHRADLYSLGVLLYEVLAGRLPFEPTDPAGLIRAHLEEEPPPPGRWRTGLDPAVEAIVLRLLRKRPAERYQSARQVMEALAQFAAAGPAAAAPAVLRSRPPRLVGRERILASIERLLAGLVGVEPPEEPLRHLLCGPPGSGKSRLAEEARILARSRGVEVVWPEPAGTSISPFDLLRRLQEGLSAAQRRLTATGPPAQPPEKTAAPPHPWPQLVELTRHAPLLIVLEDLHSSDADSLLALSKLLRRGDGGRVAVLATSRLPLPDLSAALAQAWSQGDDERQEALEPLADEQVSLLLASMFGVAGDAAVPEALLRRSAGNPRFAIEWARTLAERGVLEVREGVWRLDSEALTSIAAPPELVELVHSRLRDLSPPALRLLTALAAFDRPVAAGDAASVAEIEPESLADAVQELLDRGVLAIRGERGPEALQNPLPAPIPDLALAHATLRDAALGLAGEGMRAVLARVARQIEAAGGASAAEMALRWRQAGEPARLKEHALRGAVEAAAAGASELELKLCEWALESTPEEAGAERLDLLRRIAAILHSMEIWDRAVQAHRRVQDAARALGDRSALIDALVEEHSRHVTGQKFVEARRLEIAIRCEFPSFPNLQSEAKFERNMGQRSATENDMQGMRMHMEHAVSLFREAGRPVEAALCLNNLASYMLWTHHPDVTEPLLVESETVLRECGAAAWLFLPRLNLKDVARQRGLWAEAERRALQGLDDPRVKLTARLLPKVLAALGDIREHGGSPDRALEHYQEAAELARCEGLEHERLHALELHGALLRRLGLHERAAQIHSQALALARRLRLPAQVAFQAAALAEDMCAAGDGARAAELAREACSEAEQAGHERARVRALLAECRAALLLADRDTASEALARARARVDGSFQHAESACIEILAARLCLARSEEREAGAALERGLEHACLGSLPAGQAEILALRLDSGLSPDRAADAARLRDAVDALTRGAVDATVIRLARQAPAWRNALERAGAPDATGAAAGNDPRLSERRTLRALAEMGSIIEKLDDPRQLASSVLECARELVGAERALLVLTARDGGGATTAAASGLSPETEPEALAFSRDALARGLENPLLILDAGVDPRLASSLSVERFGIRSVLCVPLRLRGALHGAVYLDSRARVLEAGADHLRFLEAFAQQMAAALDAGRLLGTLRSERERLRSRASERYRFHALLGRSPAMQEVYDLLEPFSKSDLPVLITGESGTGKELVARALHWNGPRREGPFVAENCAAIPQPLLESELFGHLRGAFTGADRDRRGVFAEAAGGTLLLDEIGEMSPHLQAKLLRALQEKEVRPLGAARPVSVNVRVVAATHRDPAAAVRDGHFREDLLYRLRVLTLNLPPLRERLEDLPLLARHFLAEHRREHGRGPTDLSPQMVDRLARHPWKGNVRELRSEIVKLALVAGGERVEVRDLEAHPDLFASILRPGRPAPRPQAGTLRDVERHEVERAMRAAQGDKQKAATLLGLSRATLYRKLRRYRIPPPPGH